MKANWNYGKVQPKESNKYRIIGISTKGNVVEEIVDYSSDDGWQIGNNWTVLWWKDVRKR